jgi:hypothetical protein
VCLRYLVVGYLLDMRWIARLSTARSLIVQNRPCWLIVFVIGLVDNLWRLMMLTYRLLTKTRCCTVHPGRWRDLGMSSVARAERDKQRNAAVSVVWFTLAVSWSEAQK